MYHRNITSNIKNALKDTPAILINGARQTGKSTLAKDIISNVRGAEYFTMDDIVTMNSAINDTDEFVAGFNKPVVLDEVQKVPQLFPAIKKSIDNNRKPGRFILTGSANIFHISKISESLAGRMEIQTLYPLSQGEISGIKEGFIDYVFKSNSKFNISNISTKKVWAEVIRGGFPEAVVRKNSERRKAWFASYLTNILQKDIRDISNIEGLTDMPRLLKLIAVRAATMFNSSDVSRVMKIPLTTVKRYLSLLEATFLINYIFPYSGNLGKRLIKTPKVLLTDTGLASYLLGMNESDENSFQIEDTIRGQLLENFVIMELKKQITWSKTKPEVYYYRTHDGVEVDILLENEKGHIVGIEIKSNSTVNTSDFKGLYSVADTLGKKFLRGILLYNGNKVVSFGKNFTAMPVSSIWNVNAKKV